MRWWTHRTHTKHRAAAAVSRLLPLQWPNFLPIFLTHSLTHSVFYIVSLKRRNFIFYSLFRRRAGLLQFNLKHTQNPIKCCRFLWATINDIVAYRRSLTNHIHTHKIISTSFCSFFLSCDAVIINSTFGYALPLQIN